MIWKNFLTALLVLSMMGIAFCLFNLWIGMFKEIGVRDSAKGAFLIISWSLWAAGDEELGRRGHTELRRKLVRYTFISLAVSMVLMICAGLFFKVMSSLLFVCSFSPFWVLVVSPFPLALYLNRSQNKPTPLSTIANAP